MMSIKMIVTDLDRTLLRTDKTISAYTEKVLKCCSERGVKVVFATARPKNRVDILPYIHLADAIITDNGSVVYIGDEITHSSGIPAEAVKPFIRKLVATLPEIRISIEYPHLKIANFDKSELWLAEIINDIAHPLDTPATKIVVNAGVEIYGFVCALLPNDLYAQLCEGRLILIMQRDTTKWNAIKAVAAHFGISTAETTAFGDDYNDIQMLQNCGFGIAVANALDEVKVAANCVCSTNDEDGVAKWLDENLLCRAGYWSNVDTIIAESEIIIERPKGSKHPRYDFIYPLNYGYLKDTITSDGGGIDVWRGSLFETVCDAVICTIDLLKKDSEIKLLIGCTEEEKVIIMRFHNDSKYMKGTMIRREGKVML